MIPFCELWDSTHAASVKALGWNGTDVGTGLTEQSAAESL